jgi:uncharacterized membrane protein
MEQFALLAGSGVLFVLALVVAWKITWLLLKIFCWLVAFAALVTMLVWCLHHFSPPV